MQLRIPGPTPCSPEVLEVMGRQMMNHRGPSFEQVVSSVTPKLQKVFQTRGDVFVLTGSGTGGLEAGIVNVLSPGDKVLAVTTGVFGERFADIARNHGAQVEQLSFEWGKAADPDAIRQKLKAETDIKAVLVTQNETSTGVTNDMQEISSIVKGLGRLLLVDAVSGLGAIDLPMDDWHCDVVITASQKAWMLPPGLAMVGVSDEAWRAHSEARMPRFYWDFTRAKKILERNQTPWTPAVPQYCALDVALDSILAEGLPNVFARHTRVGSMAREGLKTLGLPLFADEAHASDTVTAVGGADRFDLQKLVRVLRDEHDVHVAGGQRALSGKIIRLAHLGYVNERDIETTLDAVRQSLPKVAL
ncbi:MAG: pyridoxal-phosphate-dependent aminotransferase family protein [Chloroflexota bacterium]